MKTIKTVCARDCYDVCSLVVSLENEKNIRRIKGDPGHPVTRGTLCPRSAGDGVRLSKNRIETPLIKNNGRLTKTGWREAMDVVADKLAETIQKHGPESVLFLNYAGNTGLFANAYPHRLWNAIGATRTDQALCSKSGHVGLSLHYGLSYGADPAAMPHNGLIVFWGINPAVSAPHLWRLARMARRTGNSRIVVVDPIETRSAKRADLWIRPRPGKDVALAYGIMALLIETGKVESAFIREWTTGFEHLKKETERWPLKRVEDVTGVRQASINLLAQLYASTRPSLTIIGYSLQHCAGGADQVRAVSLIPALLGLHRGFFYGNGSAYFVDMNLIQGKTMSQNKSRIIHQVAVADHLSRGDFKFTYVSCMNPAMTLPNQHAFRNGIRRNHVFLAVHDTHWTKTAALADAVLPAPTFLEKDDIIIPDSHNYIQWSPKAVSPVTDSRHEIWVMRQLANRLNLDDCWLYEDATAVVRHAMTHAFKTGNFDELMAGRLLTLKRRPANEYQTGSGKIELYSHEAASRGWSPLPVCRPEPDESFPLVYITSAITLYTHTQFQEVYGKIPAQVHIHPKDAAQGSIEDGAIVSVFNEYGKIRLRARISERIPQGVVWSPKELEGLDGHAQNSLMSSLPQEIGGGPRFNSTRVAVTRE